jgi:hypothetical protein
VTIADGLVFEHEAILAAGPVCGVTEFKDEPRGVANEEGRIGFLQVLQEGGPDAIGLADIDPLAGVGDSVDAGRRRRVFAD